MRLRRTVCALKFWRSKPSFSFRRDPIVPLRKSSGLTRARFAMPVNQLRKRVGLDGKERRTRQIGERNGERATLLWGQYPRRCILRSKDSSCKSLG